MLKPAQLYKESIISNYMSRMYDIDYQFYFGCQGASPPEIPDDTFNSHWFASVDESDNVIGFITYDINSGSDSCCNFGIMSFDKGNLTFIRDVKRAIDDIFYKYNFARVEFFCFSGNSALRGYRNFIKKYGGREVGIFKNSNRLMDGKLYDRVLFEILQEDYCKNGKKKVPEVTVITRSGLRVR